MGQVNDICANVIDQNKDNIVPMKEDEEEEKLKKGSDKGLQLLKQEPEAVSKRHISNLAAIEAMPNQERNPEKKSY